MNIIINLIPIKKGGGQQVGNSFVKVLRDLVDLNDEYFFLVTENTFVDNTITELGFKNVVRVKNSSFSRFWFEYVNLHEFIKIYNIQCIFTMFGPDLKKSGIPSIVGCAYSNIFFPEIDFWSGRPVYKKYLLKLIDKFRLSRTLQADGIIFENESMQARASKIYGFEQRKTIMIKPSISKVDHGGTFSKDILEKVKFFPNDFKVLMLAGWHPNKNMAQVPKILYELREIGITSFSFVMTVETGHIESIKMMSEAKYLGVEDKIFLIGAVKPTDIEYLYNNVDAVMLLSLLESFSNNIIESWIYKKPLIISNLEWAKSICKKAAIYVWRDDPKDIAHKIKELLHKSFYEEFVVKGLQEASTYPTPVEKVEMQLNFIKRIVHEESY